MTCKDSNNETASSCVDACGNVYYSRDDTLTSVTINVRPCEKAAPGDHWRKVAERKQPMEPTSNCASGAQLGSCLSQAEPERPMPNRRRETEAKARPRDQAAAEKWKSSRPRQKQARAKPGTRKVQPRTSKPRPRHRDSAEQRTLS